VTQPRSTARRLIVQLATVTVLVMAALGIAISLTVRHNLVEQDYAELENKAALVADIINAATPAEHATRLAEALGHHPDIAFWITDAWGETLVSTASPTLREHAGAMSPDVEPVRRNWQLGDGNSYRVLYQKQAGGHGGASLLAVNQNRHAAFLRRFHQLLLACIIAAALASSLLGGYAVHRTLRPLRTLADEALQITAERLDRRLSVGSAPVELEQLAQTLNGMLARLQQDFTRLSDFSGDLAHELRTPITNMLTQVHVVLAQPRDNAAYRDVLGSCAEELQRLSLIVGDMLYLAQAEAGGGLPSSEQVVLEPLVDDLLEFYGLSAEDKQVQLIRNGSGCVQGDRLMLRRALANLLANAIQHCPSGKQVSVRIDTYQAQCRIEVVNPGEAIPAHALPRVFDRFYRADSSRTRGRGEGAGLGLSITQAIVHAHGGRIQVHSDATATVFRVLLPCR